MGNFDSLSQLRAAGIAIGASQQELDVLAGLSESEVALLCTVAERLDQAGPEVAAHSNGDIGGTFW